MKKAMNVSLSKCSGPKESDFKLITYLSNFLLEPLTFEFGDELVHFDKISTFSLKPNFWRSDSCDNCGRCCGNKGMAYFESEMPKLWSSSAVHVVDGLLPRLNPVEIKLNGKSKILYTHRPLTARDCWVNKSEGRSLISCPYANKIDDSKVYCHIHTDRSWTCRFPHLRFTTKNGKTSATIAPYGRNWALKCYAEFGSVTKESIQHRLDTLKSFYVDIKYLDIDTWLPTIITYIEENIDKLASNPPEDEILFRTISQRKLF